MINLKIKKTCNPQGARGEKKKNIGEKAIISIIILLCLTLYIFHFVSVQNYIYGTCLLVD